MLKRVIALLIVVCLSGIVQANGAESTRALPDIPVRNQVTVLNIGIEICLSCQRMTSVIKELENEYGGRVAFIRLDLQEHKEQSEKYGLRGIPTQIFFDREGKVRFRHEGYLSKKRCVGFLKELGVK